VSFAAITLCVASQRVFSLVVFVVAVYFFIDSVRKLLDTPSYRLTHGQDIFKKEESKKAKNDEGQGEEEDAEEFILAAEIFRYTYTTTTTTTTTTNNNNNNNNNSNNNTVLFTSIFPVIL